MVDFPPRLEFFFPFVSYNKRFGFLSRRDIETDGLARSFLSRRDSEIDGLARSLLYPCGARVENEEPLWRDMVPAFLI